MEFFGGEGAMRSPTDHAPGAQHRSILVVEDERPIARFIELELLQAGYQVRLATDGIEAVMQASHQPPDLVILDLMIPGIDGLEVCRRLRSGPGALPDLPIVIVTAKGSIPDRVRGLKTGADDYVTKPFAIEELLARIEALLRRSGATGRVVPSETRLVVADVVLDTTTREVTRSNLHLELTTKEYELLDYLMRHPRQVLRREQIYYRLPQIRSRLYACRLHVSYQA